MFPIRLPAPCRSVTFPFADDTADNEDWYSFYGDGDTSFTPITNKNLKSYDGYSEVDNVKLYSSISNLHIKKLCKTEMQVCSVHLTVRSKT